MRNNGNVLIVIMVLIIAVIASVTVLAMSGQHEDTIERILLFVAPTVAALLAVGKAAQAVEHSKESSEKSGAVLQKLEDGFKDELTHSLADWFDKEQAAESTKRRGK